MDTPLPPADDATQLVPGFGSLDYWQALAAYFAPFCAAGSLIFAGISAINAMEQTARLGAIEEQLAQISTQISALQAKISEEIADVEYKNLTASVMGTKQTFSEYLINGVNSSADLLPLLHELNDTAYDIYEYLQDSSTVGPYVVAYGSLYCLLFPIQINILQAYYSAEADIVSAIQDIAPQFLETHDRVIANATAIGQNRVSDIIFAQKVITVKGDGSTFINTWSWTVDGNGRRVYSDANTAQTDHAQDVADAVSDATGKLATVYDAAANSTGAHSLSPFRPILPRRPGAGLLTQPRA